MLLRSISIVLLVAACGVEAEDGESDALAQGGKADGGFSETELAAAVKAANELSLAQLDDDVPLSARAAKNIVTHRAGADGFDGTADDNPFDDASELDAIAYVGPVAFAALIDYARGAGWVADLPALVRGSRPWEYIADGFGETMAIGDDGTLYVGAPSFADTQTYAGRGAIYMYPRTATGWGAPVILKTQPDANQRVATGFGGAFEIEGDTLVVAGHRVHVFGVSPDVTREGSNPVSIFERTNGTWTMTQMLVPEWWEKGFGQSVAFSGDTLVVGAPHHDNGAKCNGAAYVYKKSSTGWKLDTLLTNPSGVECQYGPGRYFGRTVKIAGGSVFVSSPTEPDATGADVGAVYVYSLASLTAAPKRLQPTGLGPVPSVDYPAGYFGDELAIDGDTLAMSARGYRSVFIYKKSGSTWTLDNQIQLDLRARVGTGVGIRSIALDGGRLLIGATGSGGYRGAVFMFRETSGGWSETGMSGATGTRRAQYFGQSVALQGDVVAVGASGSAPVSPQSTQPVTPGSFYSN